MHLLNSAAWSRVTRRRSERDLNSGLPQAWLRAGLRISELDSYRPQPGCQDLPPLEVGVAPSPADRSLLVVRFPSGAWDFCLPEEDDNVTPRGHASDLERFRIELPASSPVRRGWAGQALQLILLRISGSIIEAAARRGLPLAARKLEARLWRRAGLAEGWHRMTRVGGSARLLPEIPQAGQGRVLLLLHGTFSSTLASFGRWLSSGDFAALERLYPGGIFGYEHYSFSRSLTENLTQLCLELAPAEQATNSVSQPGLQAAGISASASAPLPCDVVGYSRGGLLARLLAQSDRFEVGKLVLCAVPNLGTPLASGKRWRESLGWLANLLELCPDHPLLAGGELVAHGAIWLATRLTSDLPGLKDMQQGASLLGSLASSPLSVESCAALTANYQPAGNVLERLLDLGSDRFFSEPNDLVVPCRGGRELGAGNARLDDRSVACFGPGGNIRAVDGTVQHLNLLNQVESGELILRALSGKFFELPSYARRSSGRALPPTGVGSLTNRGANSREPNHGHPEYPNRRSYPRTSQVDRSFQLMILGRPDSLGLRTAAWPKERRRSEAMILATYGGARVFHPFPLNGRDGDPQAGRRFQRIISIHEKINDRLAGRRSELPSARELRELGEHLFNTLFHGPVRTLYDVARTEQGAERLNLIITCSIPWLAGKPWELAWDPLRRKFLATEDVQIVRGVFTAVPAERPVCQQRPLRILIVEAQPAGTALLSIEEERERIVYRFRGLVAAGAAEISVLVSARPEALHDRLWQAQLRGCPFDVVHFIGHGDFDNHAREGQLLFLSAEGNQPLFVGVQTLRELLCNRGLRLVFLNACDTARQPGSRDRGLAQSLVEAGLPAVVANQFPVLDPSALAFAERFYWSLAQGCSLGAAAREARISVNYSASREAIDWAVPVLYARDPDETICQPLLPKGSSFPDGISVPDLPLPGRGQPKARVGMVDLTRDFPGLEQTLRRLSAVQDYFHFRRQELAPPIDVWRRELELESGRPRTFLIANELATRLQGEVERLQLDYLVCLTNCWLSDSDSGDQNLLGWWSDLRDCPVLVLSTAGLGIESDAEATSRVVANEFVACCGGFLHDAWTREESGIAHLDGPADSVFRYDPQRSGTAIQSLLRIREPQRTRLLETIPSRLDPARLIAALDQLLT